MRNQILIEITPVSPVGWKGCQPTCTSSEKRGTLTKGSGRACFRRVSATDTAMCPQQGHPALLSTLQGALLTPLPMGETGTTWLHLNQDRHSLLTALSRSTGNSGIWIYITHLLCSQKQVGIQNNPVLRHREVLLLFYF